MFWSYTRGRKVNVFFFYILISIMFLARALASINTSFVGQILCSEPFLCGTNPLLSPFLVGQIIFCHPSFVEKSPAVTLPLWDKSSVVTIPLWDKSSVVTLFLWDKSYVITLRLQDKSSVFTESSVHATERRHLNILVIL